MRRNKILKWVLLIFVFLYGFAYVLIETYGDHLVANILKDQVKQYPGYSLQIGSISHRVWNPFALKVRNLRLIYQSEQKINISSVFMSISFKALLQKKITLNRFDTVIESINLDQGDLKRLSANPNGKEASKPVKKEDPLRLQIQKASLVVQKLDYPDIKVQELKLGTNNFQATLDEDPMRSMKGVFGLQVGTILHPLVEVKDCQSQISVSQLLASVEDLQCKVFDEEFILSMKLPLVANPQEVEVKFHLNAFDLARMSSYMGEDFAYPMVGKIKVNGTFTLPSLENYLGASGTVTLSSQQIEIKNINANTLMEAYLDSNKTSLLNVAGFVTLGPVGVLASQSAKMSEAIPGVMGGKTHIETLNAQIKMNKGQADLEDVAFSTDQFRVAAVGSVQLQNKTFEGLKVGFLNEKGCADLVQKIGGTFDQPEFGVSKSVLKTVVAPVTNVGKKIGNLVTGGCKVFYNGSVSHPSSE